MIPNRHKVVGESRCSRRHLPASRRQMWIVLCGVVLALTQTACFELQDVPSCIGGVRDDGPDGYVEMRQDSPGAYIPWGVYPTLAYYSDAHWVVDSSIDGTVVEHKDQNYPPHGTISPSRVIPGKVLKIKGYANVINGAKASVLGLCKMA
jgi:hypothetical protein